MAATKSGGNVTTPDARALPDTRHVYGPRPVGALMPGLTRAAFKVRSPAAAQLMAEWPSVVGPALAAITAPRRLAGGTLTLACAGPVAMELQHLSAELIARINGALGRAMVERLRFVQDLAPPNAGPIAAPRRAATPVEVSGVAPGELRDALAALGGAIRQTRDRA